MPKLTEKQKEFLREPHVGVVTTLRPDGTPHSTVVWVDVEDGVVSFNTAYGRAKPEHVERTPRVSVAVVDESDPYRYIALDGTAELTTEDADAQIDRLAKKYLGKDEYPFREEGERRVKVRVRPERVTAVGLD